MKKSEYILRSTAGLIILVFIFLFMHSETELLDKHNESCKDFDVCIILEKASFDNNDNFDNLVKISHDVFQVTDFKIFHIVQEYTKLESITPNDVVKPPEKIFIKNQILII